MTLVCENQTPVGRRIRVVPSQIVLERWHGEEGKTSAIVGEVYPFMYEVTLDSGYILCFRGNEIEDLGWEK